MFLFKNTEEYFIYSNFHVFKLHSPVRFESYIHPGNHYHNGNTEHFHQL